jgi:Tat protein translocase TatC
VDPNPPTGLTPAPPTIEYCYRHPSVQTGVHCTRCGRPICTECMIPAPVGYQCPECVQQARREFRQGPGRPRLRVSGLSATKLLLVALLAGFALALPVVLWQLWSFLAPAVEEHAERTVLMFVLLATVLLACGTAFGYWIVLPKAIHFLTNFDNSVYNVQIRARDYFSFVITVLLAVGLVFELPIFILALVRLGVLSTRTLRRNRRLGYFIVAVVAVLLPGIDPVTTTFEMLPLMALYEGSIWLSVVVERRAPRVETSMETP